MKNRIVADGTLRHYSLTVAMASHFSSQFFR